jgi:hypothetical protein
MGSNGLIDQGGGVDCLNWLRREEGKVGRRRGAAGIARRRRVSWAVRGGRRNERGKGRLTGGAQASASRRKKKKERRRGGPARVLADGPLGRLG